MKVRFYNISLYNEEKKSETKSMLKLKSIHIYPDLDKQQSNLIHLQICNQKLTHCM